MGGWAPGWWRRAGSDEVIVVEEEERVRDGQREAVHVAVETAEIVLGERLRVDHVAVAGEDPQIPRGDPPQAPPAEWARLRPRVPAVSWRK